jgi:hypothetical protein
MTRRTRIITIAAAVAAIIGVAACTEPDTMNKLQSPGGEINDLSAEDVEYIDDNADYVLGKWWHEEMTATQRAEACQVWRDDEGAARNTMRQVFAQEHLASAGLSLSDYFDLLDDNC